MTTKPSQEKQNLGKNYANAQIISQLLKTCGGKAHLIRFPRKLNTKEQTTTPIYSHTLEAELSKIIFDEQRSSASSRTCRKQSKLYFIKIVIPTRGT